jgi:hypothetical protein
MIFKSWSIFRVQWPPIRGGRKSTKTNHPESFCMGVYLAAFGSPPCAAYHSLATITARAWLIDTTGGRCADSEGAACCDSGRQPKAKMQAVTRLRARTAPSRTSTSPNAAHYSRSARRMKKPRASQLIQRLPSSENNSPDPLGQGLDAYLIERPSAGDSFNRRFAEAESVRGRSPPRFVPGSNNRFTKHPTAAAFLSPSLQMHHSARALHLKPSRG